MLLWLDITSFLRGKTALTVVFGGMKSAFKHKNEILISFQGVVGYCMLLSQGCTLGCDASPFQGLSGLECGLCIHRQAHGRQFDKLMAGTDGEDNFTFAGTANFPAGRIGNN